ncbi:glycoside hydrolase family 65 protein [Planococcus lenghuensis]|uniref:Family 65 glycosyl hydrolase n=1 Tax=Planococcus lenghuensis TaxID=2213202 RepID=A0A1Q2L2X6_9BACL|nr:glycosyl hydrolase family 65 protein [Planococcus lenghuensis]AQQ54818.1 family 65 glycosyl hydrolase [Planococcus lenghuensis]
MTWKLAQSTELDNPNLLLSESLLTLGNGYLGVRGNFEEGYDGQFKSIRGTYINAFHDETEIKYGERLHGFPLTQQKMLNVIDSQTVEVYIGDERFSLFEGEVLSFERNLHMDRGFAERIIRWRSPQGRETRLHFRRLVSFTVKELFAIDIRVEPLNHSEQVVFFSTVNGDVSNYVDVNDPRLASGHAKRLNVTDIRYEHGLSLVRDTTMITNLEVACATATAVKAGSYIHAQHTKHYAVEETYECAGGEPVTFTKFNVYTDTLRHGNGLVESGIAIQDLQRDTKFDELLAAQRDYLDHFWSISDVEIDGDTELQEGIRFSLYQLLQSVGKDPYSNISAKGLSGEGYEGHYFWDTEIYMLPAFLMTQPDIAKNLLLHRYAILDNARMRARVMGHDKGALFPWRTITGPESSAYFPAGTAQYHISADIAYSYIQYYLVTQDEEFLRKEMAEVLFETARFWIEVGHMKDGKFHIDSVTGPDEYTCIVNNNYYTNVMAKHNLEWAGKVYRLLEEEHSGRLAELVKKIGLDSKEPGEWEEAATHMFLPYDEILKINAQDDSFLQKKRWDLENTPKEKFPLLLHYHPLTLYRYQVLKQADTVLAHFLLEDEESLETIRNSFDYYEDLTTHDSSLSYCVYGIMASRLGYRDKAYRYFKETARLDLDNIHGNTKDGLHMASMGGTWLSIVSGFGGLRVKDSGLSLNPWLPENWDGLGFRVRYQDRLIKVRVESERVIYTLIEGEDLPITHHGRDFVLVSGRETIIQWNGQEDEALIR